jgi:hypothetical protein|tara:strand:+ start:605 stop:802 length:198 start_codon:yes stop_codon:yes gene_type:complete
MQVNDNLIARVICDQDSGYCYALILGELMRTKIGKEKMYTNDLNDWQYIDSKDPETIKIIDQLNE